MLKSAGWAELGRPGAAAAAQEKFPQNACVHMSRAARRIHLAGYGYDSSTAGVAWT